MSDNEYRFMTHWTVRATVKEVTDVLGDTLSLPRWWPSVYLDVKRLKAGDETGVGEEIDLYTKGFLPYTLRWQFRVTEVEPYKRTKLESSGDFVGYGIWTFTEDGEWTHITYEWVISAEKPLLRDLSAILKPFFEANHRWAMDKGLKSLELELLRRRATTDEERAQIPSPPPGTTTSPVPYLLIGLAILLLAFGLISMLGRDD
jgi:hypothetical protein